MHSLDTNCAHCGRPVPQNLLGTFNPKQANHSPDSTRLEFCCSGCATVYAILHECNLDDYYRLRAELSDSNPQPAKVSDKDYRGYDDPIFLDQTARKLAGGLLEVELYVEGTHCIACAWLIEKILVERAGAITARLDLGRSVVSLTFDPVKTPLSHLARQLDRIGYPPHPLFDTAQKGLLKSERTLLTRIGVAAAGAGNIMLLAFALYAGEYSGMEQQYTSLFRWVSLVLTLPVLLYSAFPFYQGAYHSIRNRVAAIDLPIALGITISFLASTIATIFHRSEVYFDSITSLIFLLLVGRFVLARANRWANEASVSLLGNVPKLVRVLRGESEIELPIQELTTGEIILLKPGDVVPVDGIVLDHPATVSEASLTGEATIQWKQPGTIIYAANQVVERSLKLRTEAVGVATRLGRLTEMMRAAKSDRAPMTIMTDRIAGWFVIGVIALAIVTIAIWWHIDPMKALWFTTAMMVVTCPCALGIAVPATYASAIGFAAKHGIYIRGASVLEKAASVNTILLDKTGTLTMGEPVLREIEMIANVSSNIDREMLLRKISAVERQSNHHYRKSLLRDDDREFTIDDFIQVPGAGISGRITANGIVERITIGTEQYVTGIISTPEPHAKHLDSTPIWVAIDSTAVAKIWLHDPIRPEAKTVIEELKSLGMKLEIVSGDAFEPVSSVAKSLEISNFFSRMTPEAKLEHVANMSKTAHACVLMVGDGVNDAAALGIVDVGISPAGSAEVTREAAAVFLVNPGIEPVVSLLRLARRTSNRIRLNLAIAFLYNILGAILAITGHVTPLVAAVLMPISSLTSLYIATRRGFLQWK